MHILTVVVAALTHSLPCNQAYFCIIFVIIIIMPEFSERKKKTLLLENLMQQNRLVVKGFTITNSISKQQDCCAILAIFIIIKI